jgi:hypothetical protein
LQNFTRRQNDSERLTKRLRATLAMPELQGIKAMAGDYMARNLLPFLIGIVSPIAGTWWLLLGH